MLREKISPDRPPHPTARKPLVIVWQLAKRSSPPATSAPTRRKQGRCGFAQGRVIRASAHPLALGLAWPLRSQVISCVGGGTRLHGALPGVSSCKLRSKIWRISWISTRSSMSSVTNNSTNRSSIVIRCALGFELLSAGILLCAAMGTHKKSGSRIRLPVKIW